MDPLSRLRNNKRVNGFFLCLIIVHLVASVLVSILAMGAVEIGTFTALLLTQLLLLVPSFIFILTDKEDVPGRLRFRRLKVGTVLLVILFTFLMMPLISLINVVSQLFTTNAAAELSGEFIGMPAVLTVFMVGMFGPFCEEFAFRGIIFGGFRRSGAVLAGAVLSSVYFGIMHLNLNQMSYAIILGVVFCLLVEGTGSIWASITAHVVVNTWNVFLLLFMDKLYDSMGLDIFELAEEAVTTDQKLAMTGYLLVGSLISSAIALGVFIVICRNEDRWDDVVSMFCKTADTKTADMETADAEIKDTKVRLLTLSGYIAIALCIFIIFFLDRVLEMFV